ncbi:MAG: cell wall hydrolase [Euryarchaeota archaeon]|nr:cell wall hydrolase [Euryarchaeota archaeon]
MTLIRKILKERILPSINVWSVGWFLMLAVILSLSGLKIMHIKNTADAREMMSQKELNEKHAFYNDEIECLTTNLYHEARNEPIIGQMAVNFVVFNRVKSEDFPDSICGVTLQARSYKENGEPVKNSCQFSWYCDGKADEIKNIKKYNQLYQLSYNMFYNANKLDDVTEGALYYHADYVNPKWSRVHEKVVQIDTHIFYRANED